MFRKSIIVLILTTLPLAGFAKTYPFTDAVWTVSAEESERTTYLGQAALKLSSGGAYINDLDLQDGVIEFDIAVDQARGFSGVFFRMQSAGNYEHFYIRPHQSGNPDANQYTPMFNQVSAWQLYHGVDYATAMDYSFNQWMHIKIIYQGDRAEVYLDSDTPVLHIQELKRGFSSGTVGVNAAGDAPVYFSNFTVSPLSEEHLFSEKKEMTPTNETIVTSWMVSDGFDQQSLSHELGDQSQRKWTQLNSEASGITNLAKIQGLSEGANTAFARLMIQSETDQVKQINFGYSDAVRIYLNGQALYQGQNIYQSRDYRYLGTIGLFDSVFLPLKAGRNELWFAVTENFGGWGIMAEFDNMQGIQLLQ